MSPFRRRKDRREADLRLRARRARLAERERLAYEQERAAESGEETVEGPVAEPYQRPAEKAYEPPERPAEEGYEPPDPTARSSEAAAPRPPVQRRRRTARARRRRRLPQRPKLRGLGTASRSGARATVRQAQPGVRRLGAGLGRVLPRPLIWLLRLAALVERAIAASLSAARRLAGEALAIADRIATPERVVVLVTAGAATCLVVSQFVAYRGVEVGQPQYADVSAVAPPPQTDPIDAGAAHAYVLVPLAVLAVAIAVIALLSGRWRLGRLISLVGLAGIAISLAIDLPKGLDAGIAGTAFAGANAILIEGFYAQLAASAVLVLCGWVLSINLRRRGGVPAPRRRALRSRARAGRAPSVAGGGA